ncbi:MAG: phosphatidylserine decarboxylase family protein [Bacteroidetes bacterium]|nr:phosphatidylserine decarboxylase family protein [Bacteroidota bacterium]MBK9524998.1 phosphatidylserine decarboxylase family protein [Bacteroidota bacterium]MBK9543857.1 phosphatidylserine decarboxylase family protein [Bacteroidota bacterium]MBP6402229.1 phosphatidylserine decarboxylase family protein [Bacteroidia bacterium]MBP6650677.1 phosphatidylserine decarboxylase family protein [Bacteroidia bacterium]
MTIHKEGYATLTITILVLAGLNIIGDQFLTMYPFLRISILVVTIILFLIILQFFRHPSRTITKNEKHVICPADGKVVVIEETVEGEVLKDKRIQVSIFMSPFNVHVNRYPVSGNITFCKYHPGLYLVAWHPKSSTENERTTVVIETNSKISILVRQIAGALARRIVCYSEQGMKVQQGDELGFIKFGSRVDLFLPLNAKIKVSMDQKVTGGETILAELP